MGVNSESYLQEELVGTTVVTVIKHVAEDGSLSNHITFSNGKTLSFGMDYCTQLSYPQTKEEAN